ncbi:MAG TPA: pilus assembly protein TadG-related protein, partial [Planctomycetaceae bacterium]|nr:pilus assembly protein TadG-related protein [Planctomycetaceae bacterium]
MSPVRRTLRTGTARLARLHRDERGTISILTVVTLIGLMMLLGLVVNVGRHIDDKVKMQNAADAATYSGGTVLARGMNSVAFTNHLLCDVFALTAFMREARDRNAEAMVPDILAAWSKIGPIFAESEFPKFAALGPAITKKVPLEQEAVHSYGEMSAAISELVLPVLEYVLREQLIPEFQRSVVRSLPQLAQQTTNEVTRRHSLKQPKRPGLGMLWRTNALPVGYPDENDPQQRTLPAVDPTPGSNGGQSDPVPDPHPDGLAGSDYNRISNPQLYVELAVMDRDRYSKMYLEQWIADRMQFFATEAKMSQYINLFRVFTGVYGPPRATCGQLGKLLYEEYPNSNLPHVIRLTENMMTPDALRGSGDQPSINAYLERNFMFVGIVYRRQFAESFAGLFKNPLGSDPQTLTQVHLFIPQPRLWPPNAAGGAGLAAGGAGQTGGG